jgi:hypothetical protein
MLLAGSPPVYLSSNTTAAEAITGGGESMTYNSDGFAFNGTNTITFHGETYVAWNWLGANTTVSNTVGSITSTVSANTTSGFSIVRWTGTSGAAQLVMD